MSKVIIRTDTVDGFFARGKDAARRADQAQAFDGKVTLSLEDPQRMSTILSEVQPGAWLSEGRALDGSQD